MSDDRSTATAEETAPAQTGHPAPARSQVRSSVLWFGLFGGPVAWSVQTLVNLPVASHACYPRLFPLNAPAIGGLRGIVFLVSLLAVIVTLAATASALRAWRFTRHEHQQSSGKANKNRPEASALETGEGRTRFMAVAGLLTSITFVLVTLVHLSAVFLVTPCAA
jgi:hypothetical protein